ncbi:hypothetical protein HanPI659440_Chr01g0032661 [Helianthus annuus]|nr:hypothetical protein HanPI659440_Chr01g0032661 [Helianthus annuus]
MSTDFDLSLWCLVSEPNSSPNLARSKLATKQKYQGVKWLFLKVWGKTVKVTKSQGAKRKFTQEIMLGLKNDVMAATTMNAVASGVNGIFFND